MTIKVDYSDDSTELYTNEGALAVKLFNSNAAPLLDNGLKVIQINTIEDVEKGIEETVTGCDFAATPSAVTMYDADGNEQGYMHAEWSLKLRPDTENLLERP